MFEDEGRAEAGEEEYALGVLYRDGSGGKKQSYRKAAKHFGKAAAYGHRDANAAISALPQKYSGMHGMD